MICKNEKTGKWEVRTYYKNYKGERKQKKEVLKQKEKLKIGKDILNCRIIKI